MANEEMQRTMQFILDQQGRFWESIKSLEGIVQSHSVLSAQHTDQIGQLTDVVTRVVRVVEEGVQRTEEGFGRLTESQMHIDERLNALIAVVERYFSNGPRG